MTTFEWLNLIIQAQSLALVDEFVFEGENEKN